jgi:hypothetical protein
MELTKEFWDDFRRVYFRQDFAITQFCEPYGERLANDPNIINEFQTILEKALNAATPVDRAFGEALGGGPHEGIPAAMCNNVGKVYPFLAIGPRIEALQGVVSMLDGYNYFLSQNVVELIHDPWLVRDILYSRWLYWPGFKEYIDALKGLSRFEEFKDAFMSDGEIDKRQVKSSFFLSMALLRGDHTTDHIRQGFCEHFPRLTDKSLDAAAAICARDAKYYIRKEKLKREDAVMKTLQMHPKQFQSRLSRKISERKWITLDGVGNAVWPVKH